MSVAVTAQLGSLAEQLGRARAAVGRAVELQKNLQGVAEGLEEDLNKCGAAIAELAATNGSETQAWQGLADLRQRCGELSKEAFALVQGAWARTEALDGGLCALADHLLAGFDQDARRAGVHWGRVTTLADAEFYGEVAQVIRVKFPNVDFWFLPVAAHEYGHFACPRIQLETRTAVLTNLSMPVQEVLQTTKDQAMRLRLEELFADIFATFTMGIAYPATCVVLRFDPSHVEDLGFHPASSKRAETMFRTLERMDADVPKFTGTKFSKTTGVLQEIWSSGRAAVGAPAMDKGDLEAVEGALETLWPLLVEHLKGLRYRTFSVAQQLSFRPLDAAVALAEGTTVRDVINAAWLRRLAAPDRVPAITDWAEELCGRTVGSGRR